jgi:predicted SprT family Zn-dependent metalloprotease
MPSPSQEIYSAVEKAYTFFNQELFAGQLPDCLIVLQRQPKMMGYVSPKRWVNSNKRFVDELAINPEYFLGYPLIEIMQTLVHEQCHIWQAKFGSPGRRNYHNAEWANKMQDIGLMPSHTGLPGGKKTGEHMNDYAILGGKFQEAYTRLIEVGFHLPWLDRIPLVRKDKTPSVFSTTGEPIDNRLQQNEIDIYSAAVGEELIEHQQQSDLSIVEPLLAPIRLENNLKKNTRVKYRCTACGNQLWGKPNMNIICGDCQLAFKSI